MSAAYVAVFLSFFALLATTGVVLGMVGRAYAKKARAAAAKRSGRAAHV